MQDLPESSFRLLDRALFDGHVEELFQANLRTKLATSTPTHRGPALTLDPLQPWVVLGLEEVQQPGELEAVPGPQAVASHL